MLNFLLYFLLPLLVQILAVTFDFWINNKNKK